VSRFPVVNKKEASRPSIIAHIGFKWLKDVHAKL
jgi:hypothetical protein